MNGYNIEFIPSVLSPEQIRLLKQDLRSQRCWCDSRPVLAMPGFSIVYPSSLPDDINEAVKTLELQISKAANFLQNAGYEVEIHYDEDNRQMIVRQKEDLND